MVGTLEPSGWRQAGWSVPPRPLTSQGMVQPAGQALATSPARGFRVPWTGGGVERSSGGKQLRPHCLADTVELFKYRVRPTRVPGAPAFAHLSSRIMAAACNLPAAAGYCS